MESKESEEQYGRRSSKVPYQSLVLFIAGVSNRLSILQPFRKSHRATVRSPLPLCPPYVTPPPIFSSPPHLPSPRRRRRQRKSRQCGASEAGSAAGSHTLARHRTSPWMDKCSGIKRIRPIRQIVRFAFSFLLSVVFGI